MIPTVLLDIQTNLLVGHLFALSAYRQLWGASVPVFNRWFARAMWWSALGFVPVAGFFYFAYPDWSLVYMFDPQTVPRWVGPVVFVAYASGMFFGYLTAQYFLTQKMLGAFVGSALLAAFFNAAMFAATWEQYFRLATYESYHAGKTIPIWSNTAFMTHLNGGGAWMVATGVLVLVLNLRERNAAKEKAPAA